MNDMPGISPVMILAAGLLFFLGALAHRLSERVGVPALLLFLAIGMLAGSDGIGGIYFNDPVAANSVGVFALAFILFSGGLDTDWESVRPVLGRSIILATFGVAITALLVGLFCRFVLGFPLLEGLLLGSIVSSTDAAAVFAIMRSRRVKLKGLLKPLLELESGSNDPMAVFLTVTVLGFASGTVASWTASLVSLAVNMTVGVLIGAALGFLASSAFNRMHLAYEGLYPVLSMSVVLVTYGLCTSIGGNGFMAVYVCGIVMGNRDFLHKRGLTRFHDGVGWLMQIVLFVVLGLLVFPSRIPQVAGTALLVSAFLMFVARPVAVYLGLIGSSFTMQEKTLVAWTGLRGAVPVVLATFPYMAGYENSNRIFDMVFFVVVLSALLQGRTLMPVARWLGVDAPLSDRPKYPIEFERTAEMDGETLEIDIPPHSTVAGKPVAGIGLPEGVLILLIRRGNEFLVPNGRTILQQYDTLMLMADRKALEEAREVILEEESPPPETSTVKPPHDR
ncbi:MAG TPA: potassium/proton antiporter [Candidatus Fermentibacter daniensis]|nr:potassium/proton antiporter [Candidatus Fermentibacter daniensis]